MEEKSNEEIVSTRTNPMIDPAIHIWGWEIPVYLFLGGLVAGMMMISGYFLFQGTAEGDVHILPRRSPC